MQYGQVDGIDKPVSRLVQGTTMVHSEEEDAGFELLDAVFALGCNAFDTAHVYGGGDNERTVGRWVNSRGLRDDVVIIGKGAHHNADRKCVTPYDITAHLHDSLARFKFDYIDLYLLHRDDPEVPVGPIVDVLNEHREAGRIRAFGGSNWTADRVREANEYAAAHGLTPFVASSPHFSLAEQIEEPWEGCVTITGVAGASQRAWYCQSQLPVFCWSSLAGGFFSGLLNRQNQQKHEETLYLRCYGSEENFDRLERAEELGREKACSVAQIALAWLVRQPMNLFPLVASNSGSELEANLAAWKIELTPAELAWLNLEQDTR